MRDSFFVKLPSCEDLPEPVLAYAVEIYAGRCAGALAQNSALGALTVALLAADIAPADLIELLRRGNTLALESVLSGTTASADVLRAVLDHWRLSPADQMRLVSLRLAPKTARLIYYHNNLDSKQALDKLAPLVAKYYQAKFSAPSAAPRRLAPGPRTELTQFMGSRSPWSPWSTDRYEGVTYLDSTISRLAQLATVKFTIPLLIEHIGAGSDPASLRRWPVFFGLIEESPDVNLSYVLRDATKLVQAEALV